MAAFKCFSCHKVTPFFESTLKKCPHCGSTNGEVISNERLKEGLKDDDWGRIE
jgi:Zn finger protein HypA/HybF involved in hydrogenase expression